jgi:hypothetical protein
MGTGSEELGAVAIFMRLPPDLRRLNRAVAWQMARKIAVAGQPVPVPASAVLDAQWRARP